MTLLNTEKTAEQGEKGLRADGGLRIARGSARDQNNSRRMGKSKD